MPSKDDLKEVHYRAGYLTAMLTSVVGAINAVDAARRSRTPGAVSAANRGLQRTVDHARELLAEVEAIHNANQQPKETP